MSTTTTTTTTTKKPPQYGQEVLWRLMETALKKARSEVNPTELVQQAYGDEDAQVLGQDMLVGALQDMLRDQVHESILLEFKDSHQDLAARLDKVAAILQQLDAEEAAQARAEQADREAAQRALEGGLLPEGVSLEDVKMHHEYQAALQQKERLQKALSEVQSEIEVLEQEVQTTSTDTTTTALNQVAQQLGQSADLCSMIVF